MERAGFTFRREWHEAMKGLPCDIRLEVYEAIVVYGLSGTLPSGLKPMARLAFGFAKASIDADNERAERISEARREAGRRGGMKKAENVANVAIARGDDKQLLANVAIASFASFARNEHENCQDFSSGTPSESDMLGDDVANVAIARSEDVCTLSNIYNNISLNNSKSVEEGKESEKGEKPKDLKAGMEKRRAKFYESLVPFVETYGKEMVREFYDYWTEPNKSGTRMRFELERTWSLSRRLGTWAKRDTEFRSSRPVQHVVPDLSEERKEQEERMQERERWRDEAVSWEEYQESKRH